GVLPIDVITVDPVTHVAAPAQSATISLTTASYTPGSPPIPCPSDSYTLPSTGPDGLSRTAVPYGLYTATITSGASTATVSLAVNASTVAAGSVVYPLPSAVLVVL
ncbi:MAG: hypothetical protein ACRDYE_15450, partial [Acidimicrobiales bacterium]